MGEASDAIDAVEHIDAARASGYSYSSSPAVCKAFFVFPTVPSYCFSQNSRPGGVLHGLGWRYAILPWTTLPTDVTIAGNHNCHLRRCDIAQCGERS